MKLILTVAFLAIAITPTVTARKLTTTFLLGSKSTESIDFIQDQVYPLYYEFRDLVHFVFVPFGRANSTLDDAGNVSFECEHGPDDCHLSRIQLCAKAHLKNDPDKIMEFIACQMSHSAEPTGETCADQVGLPFEKLTGCYNARLGNIVQLQAEWMTNKVQSPLEDVPTTAYNWVFDQELNDLSRIDLRTVLCGMLNQDIDSCPTYPDE